MICALLSCIGDVFGENIVESLSARIARKIRHPEHISNGGSVDDCILVTVTFFLGFEVEKRVLG